MNPSDYLPPIPTLDDLSMLDDMEFSLEGIGGNSTSLARRRRKPAEVKSSNDLSDFMDLSVDEDQSKRRPRRRHDESDDDLDFSDVEIDFSDIELPKIRQADLDEISSSDEEEDFSEE